VSGITFSDGNKIRVSVYSGNGESYLGLGTLVGLVTTYAIRLPDGKLISSENAEEYPKSELEALKNSGLEYGFEYSLVKTHDNPKIVMDDGKVYYGVQVWWHPAPIVLPNNMRNIA
jgi:hypothetical protein